MALGLSACTRTTEPSATLDPSQSSAAVAPPTGQGQLASFYDQKISWESCKTAYGRYSCAWLNVPLDYANPAGETLKLRMLRVASTKGGTPSKGVLFVNPGGPGGSAVDYASAAGLPGDRVVTAAIRRAYDIVGLDPRGVGQSAPVKCLDGRGMDALLGADPTPDNQAERDSLIKLDTELGVACEAKQANVLKHVSTVEAAKDMDIARAALLQPQLNWLGKSYGTYLGATYAGLFPAKVGRMVLDGALDPQSTDVQVNLGQAQGFERATRAYVADCIKQGDCPLGTNVDAGVKKLRDFIKSLDSSPLPVTGDPYVKQLTEAWGWMGVARDLYLDVLWDFLTPALRDAMINKDGTALFEQARDYADRTEKGEYASNAMESFFAVSCLDRRGTDVTGAERERLAAEFTTKAPMWGEYMLDGSLVCANWPIPATGSSARITAAGSGPIVVVGTTRDPATPYEWAVSLADQLENGHLITRDGDGHTGYDMANSCVDKAVDAYLLDGKVPAAKTTC